MDAEFATKLINCIKSEKTSSLTCLLENEGVEKEIDGVSFINVELDRPLICRMMGPSRENITIKCKYD